MSDITFYKFKFSCFKSLSVQQIIHKAHKKHVISANNRETESRSVRRAVKQFAKALKIHQISYYTFRTPLSLATYPIIYVLVFLSECVCVCVCAVRDRNAKLFKSECCWLTRHCVSHYYGVCTTDLWYQSLFAIQNTLLLANCVDSVCLTRLVSSMFTSFKTDFLKMFFVPANMTAQH